MIKNGLVNNDQLAIPAEENALIKHSMNSQWILKFVFVVVQVVLTMSPGLVMIPFLPKRQDQ